MKDEPLLEIERLSVSFPGADGGRIRAVRDVSFAVSAGETVAIVGESGCGKSVIAQAVMRLLPPGTEISGSVIFRGKTVQPSSEEEMEKIRGKHMAMVFQNPERALNPVIRIGRQLTEPMVLHGLCRREEAEEKALEALTALGLDAATMRAYPWMCSGGMCQRVLFAAVSLLQAELVIADEPTKGLDADRIRDLEGMLAGIPADGRTSLVLITHDIGLAARLADRVLVMYCGTIVEAGRASDVLTAPAHSYTRGLLGSLPENGFCPIPGISPALSDLPPGCVFNPRCTGADEECRRSVPPMREIDGRQVRCFRC
ncbi:MAG: peptide/nickel transport system ATP-binding protein [Euryarchaeota archaeon]|nr:peptide/nickel transport system ATP-binding protein [Euryarchaeota archaeon]